MEQFVLHSRSFCNLNEDNSNNGFNSLILEKRSFTDIWILKIVTTQKNFQALKIKKTLKIFEAFFESWTCWQLTKAFKPWRFSRLWRRSSRHSIFSKTSKKIFEAFFESWRSWQLKKAFKLSSLDDLEDFEEDLQAIQYLLRPKDALRTRSLSPKEAWRPFSWRNFENFQRSFSLSPTLHLLNCALKN